MPIPEVVRGATAQTTPTMPYDPVRAGLLLPLLLRAWLAQQGGLLGRRRDPLVREASGGPEATPAELMGAAGDLSPAALGRIGVLPGRERLASDIIKRGLKEPWFHGSPHADFILGRETPTGTLSTWQMLNRPDKVAELSRTPAPQFDPNWIGFNAGLRLGEPAGVSLTRSPEVARKFGDVLRVGVDIPPSSVGQFVDPEMQRLLREAYGRGWQSVEQVPVRTSGAGAMPFGKAWDSNIPGSAIMAPERSGLIAQANQAMSDYLRQQGVEAIAYNPRRWAEYELRVLDPSKAVPFGMVPAPTKPYATIPPFEPVDVMSRYYHGRPNVSWQESRGLQDMLERHFLRSPEFPVRLRDVLGVAGAD